MVSTTLGTGEDGVSTTLGKIGLAQLGKHELSWQYNYIEGFNTFTGILNEVVAKMLV